MGRLLRAGVPAELKQEARAPVRLAAIAHVHLRARVLLIQPFNQGEAGEPFPRPRRPPLCTSETTGPINIVL